MKKFYIMAAMLAASAVPAMAYTKALIGYDTEDEIETCVYTYNADYKVIDIYRSDLREPEMAYIVRVDYDELGREVKSYLYQDIYVTSSPNYEDLVYTAYVDLSYNEQGQVCERRNYNNWGAMDDTEMWELGGVMKYYYNEAGKYSKVEVWMEIPGRDPMIMQQDDYYYDAEGRISKQETQYGDFSGNLSLYGVLEYEYNDAGRLYKRVSKEVDPNTGELLEVGFKRWTYTEDGHLLDVDDCSKSGVIQQQMSFFYPLDGNFTPASEVVFPYEFDEYDTNELYSMFTAAPDGYDFRATNMDTGLLDYVATYVYSYKDLDPVSVKSVALENGLSVLANGNGKYRLTGVADGQTVRVFGIDGSKAAEVRYDGNLDLSGLASGYYIISTRSGAVKVKR